MMTLAVLCAMEWEMEAAMVLIETRRPVVDFADVYVESVRRFLHRELRASAEFRLTFRSHKSQSLTRNYCWDQRNTEKWKAPLGRAAFLLARSGVGCAYEERTRDAQMVRGE